MNTILLVGEDELCCELGRKLITTALPAWKISGSPINKRGITKLLPELPRYAECAANVRPVLCIADSDDRCPVELRRQWFPINAPPGFLFRLAVPEAESWILADRHAVSEFFDVPLKMVPADPEARPDPKLDVLTIASKSRRKVLRSEMLGPGQTLRKGSGYNVHLAELVHHSWRTERAERLSSSLQRALADLRSLVSPT